MKTIEIQSGNQKAQFTTKSVTFDGKEFFYSKMTDVSHDASACVYAFTYEGVQKTLPYEKKDGKILSAIFSQVQHLQHPAAAPAAPAAPTAQHQAAPAPTPAAQKQPAAPTEQNQPAAPTAQPVTPTAQNQPVAPAPQPVSPAQQQTAPKPAPHGVIAPAAEAPKEKDPQAVSQETQALQPEDAPSTPTAPIATTDKKAAKQAEKERKKAEKAQKKAEKQAAKAQKKTNKKGAKDETASTGPAPAETISDETASSEPAAADLKDKTMDPEKKAKIKKSLIVFGIIVIILALLSVAYWFLFGTKDAPSNLNPNSTESQQYDDIDQLINDLQ